MKLYGGIDLHSNNSVVALLDEEEQLVYRKRLGNDAVGILEALAPYREAIVGLVAETGARQWRKPGPGNRRQTTISAVGYRCEPLICQSKSLFVPDLRCLSLICPGLALSRRGRPGFR